jgi:hypothetical protein
VVWLEDERGIHVGGLAVGGLLAEPVGFFTISTRSRIKHGNGLAPDVWSQSAHRSIGYP